MHDHSVVNTLKGVWISDKTFYSIQRRGVLCLVDAHHFSMFILPKIREAPRQFRELWLNVRYTEPQPLS